MTAIIGIIYRNYTHNTLYRSCLPIYGIAIIRSLSFLFLDDFEGNANISVAIKLVLQYIVSLFAELQKDREVMEKLEEIKRSRKLSQSKHESG